MERRRRWCVLVLGLIVAATVSAQTWQLKVGGGFASQYADKRLVGAFKFGVGYEYELGQRWTLNPSLVLSGKGWKDKDTFVNDLDESGNPKLNEEGQPIMSRMARSTNINYLELPVLANYYCRIGESKYIVLGAGPYVSCGLWGKEETKGDGRRQGAEKLYYDKEVFDLPGAHRWDAGIQVMAGYQMPKRITVGLEVDFGLARFASDSGRNVSGLVSIVYSFRR